MIRVVVADDHGVVRAGLESLLANAGDIEVVGSAATGAEAIEVARAVSPDVVLMDLSMPVMDGITATRSIASETSVVMLTSFVDRPRILEALDAGAIGYLLKDATPDELYRGIRAAAAGDSPLAPQAAIARQIPAPIPWLPPVTRTFLCSRSITFSISCYFPLKNHLSSPIICRISSSP